ncbi:HlyD family efflux transporter periplasmic adaptor subunit [Candidatus Binatia bacterium]|nr:HlyD family efflux transporter periplasmic adaptor subunit [Candidatus Binatia bacterium]
MPPRARRIVPLAVAVAVAVVAVWYVRRTDGPAHFTGFVEGEERVIRSEVSARIVDVPFAEGVAVPADAIVARLDDRDIQARLASKREEIAVLDHEIATQIERIALVESTWQREREASAADLRSAEAAAELADKTFARERELVARGISSAQRLDDTSAQRDTTRGIADKTRQVLARVEAEERQIALARRELDTLRGKRDLARAQLGEIDVLAAKYVVRAPSTPTVVQTQFAWPGELAQPGTAVVAVIDPADKYVQIYVPVADVAAVPLGRKVSIELDSQPGRRIPGEVSFVADTANFTPEKIETRSDRLGQVYRVKVRVLDGVAGLQPGTEGNVYLEDDPAALSTTHAR